MDPVTIFGALFVLSAGTERALREPAQAKRKHKLGLKGVPVTLLNAVLALDEKSAAELQACGGLEILVRMIRNGEYITKGGAA